LSGVGALCDCVSRVCGGGGGCAGSGVPLGAGPCCPDVGRCLSGVNIKGTRAHTQRELIYVCMCMFLAAPALGPYKILPIFYCNKGGRGKNILRNIVGNKGGLGGGYCTIMCNNAPFSVSSVENENNFFFRHLHPSKIRPLNNKKTPTSRLSSAVRIFACSARRLTPAAEPGQSNALHRSGLL